MSAPPSQPPSHALVSPREDSDPPVGLAPTPEEPELDLEGLTPLTHQEGRALEGDEPGFEPGFAPASSPSSTLIAPEEPFEEPFEELEAPLFPPRGGWSRRPGGDRERKRLVKGPSRKVGASGASPLRREGEEGATAALAPRAHASSALLDPELKGQRKRERAAERVGAPSLGQRRGVTVSPDSDTAAALAALEAELSQTLEQLGSGEGGAERGSVRGWGASGPGLKVATWASEHASVMGAELRAELRVTPHLELPEAFVSDAEGEGEVIKALGGARVARGLDLNDLPPDEVSRSLSELLSPSQEALDEGSQEGSHEAQGALKARSRFASSRSNLPPPKAGDVIGEAWTLEGILNKINGVDTWLARSPQGEGVVLKLAYPELLSESPMSWVFDAELRLRALQNLSQGVAQQPLAWGDDEERGCWYAALEWVEGQSVAELTKRAPLSLSQGRDLFARLAEGVASLHAQGVIHRKIQPSHIILGPEGPRLISFQWVDEVEGEDIQRKHQGVYQALSARPILLAPEWMEEGQITSAADVYALAASLLVALNPDAQGWTEAPISLRLALSSAMHPDPELRSDARGLARDLRLSARRYLYRGGRDEHQMIERLSLGEVVERVLDDELGWHAVAREGSGGEGVPSLSAWGEVEELAEAVSRVKETRSAHRRHESATEAARALETPLTSTPLPGEQPDESGERGSLGGGEVERLRRQVSELQVALNAAEQRAISQEETLSKEREELAWREGAVRELEEALEVRELSVAEQRASLETREERFQEEERQAQARWEEAKQALALADEQRAEVKALRAELEQMAEALTEREAQLKALDEELTARAVTLSERETQEEARLEQLYQEAREGLLEEEAARLLERREEEEREREVQAHAARLEEARHFALEREEERQAEAARLAELDSYLEELQQEKRARAQARAEANRPFRVEERALSEMPPPAVGELMSIEVGTELLNLRWCPAGSAWVGSEEGDGRAEERPRHRVKLTAGFWLGETPVTQGLWDQLMLKNPSQFSGAARPVEGVSWLEAVSLCNALSEREGRSPAYVVEGVGQRARVLWDQEATGYRLPTEVEWEYAARSGQEGERHLYAMGSDLEAVAWFSQNAHGETHPVGLKDPNAWGLKDLCGQVWEWTHDEWRRDAYKDRAGEHSLSYDPHLYSPLLSARVVKGGAWYDFASACRLAARPGQDPATRYGVGLRVMRPL